MGCNPTAIFPLGSGNTGAYRAVSVGAISRVIPHGVAVGHVSDPSPSNSNPLLHVPNSVFCIISPLAEADQIAALLKAAAILKKTA